MEKKEIKTVKEVKQLVAETTDLSTLKAYSLTSYNKDIARKELLAKGWKQADINVVWPVQQRKAKAKAKAKEETTAMLTLADVKNTITTYFVEYSAEDLKPIFELFDGLEKNKEQKRQKAELEKIIAAGIAAKKQLDDLDKIESK